jgi:hypothetical protein
VTAPPRDSTTPPVGLCITLWESLGVARTFGHNIPNCILADCKVDDNPFVWVGLWHPTRFWSTINQPYLRKTVPTTA